MISAFKEDNSLSCWSKEWGNFLVFRRLWKKLDLPGIIERIQKRTKIEFNLEQALFYTVLHRLNERRSDLRASKWINRVYDPLPPYLKYHYFLRAMGYMAEFKEEIERTIMELEMLTLFDCKLTSFGDLAKIFATGGVAQVVRACGSYPQCRGFESLHRHFKIIL